MATWVKLLRWLLIGIGPAVATAAEPTLFEGLAKANATIEDFESGNLNLYVQTPFRPCPHPEYPVGCPPPPPGRPSDNASVISAAAHDGNFGLRLSAVPVDIRWYYRTDAAGQVSQGESISTWVKIDGQGSGFGRPGASLGFGVTAAGGYSAVIASEPSEFRIDVRDEYNAEAVFLATKTLVAAPQTYINDHWYRVRVDWEVGGDITARLFESDGTTLLNTIRTTNSIFTTGGIGFRGFGASFDTITRATGVVPAPATLTRHLLPDFDGDGHADLLWRNPSGQVEVWLMDGDRVLGTRPFGIGWDWTVQGMGDFNGDGKADILWRHASGLVDMWLMDGLDVASASVQPYAIGWDWTVQGMGDFNGDGKADILWRHASGLVDMWLMDGPIIASANVQPYAIGWDWTVQGVGDFDGDGKADILWRHTSGLVDMWLMDGPIIASANTHQYGIDQDWTVQGVGDFDGDGKADILWRHASGPVDMWLMDGPIVASANIHPYSIDPGWTIAGVGAIDGDSQADILWQHVSGLMDSWIMDGPFIVRTGSYAGDVGEGACHGNHACFFNVGNVRKASCGGFGACNVNAGLVGESACVGERACQINHGDIGKLSCHDDLSCRNRQGPVGEGACIGNRACDGSGAGAIGKGACRGERACLNNPNSIPKAACVGPPDATGKGVCEM